MFHLASANFWGLVQPFNLSMLLALTGAALTLFRWRRLGALSALTAFLVLFLSGWTTLGALLLQPLEGRFERPEQIPDNIAGIIVLGGGFEGAINLARGGYELNASADRFVEAAVLAHRYPNLPIIVSGGSGSVFLQGEGDADTAPRLLTGLGIARERILLEGRSRDTFENARYTRELLQPQQNQKWLLVTSAFHMPRSVALFRAQGFHVVPWPADYRTTGEEGIGLSHDNVLDSLANTTTGLREWIGLATYRLTGRTPTLLPDA
ncbi:YdcF family protein [Nitratireductor basaltis]|uniref:DUF218 domain-containing protein n=1 Tax=Nitratireductor basaltis TaxID=472175 RepID=A0A084UB73_9HYPH|nr:YdcF family protein [Nitratireductor basaltis]KFB10209.1 hypothetical protein EL18_01239 [Nitratireductor basaltis]